MPKSLQKGDLNHILVDCLIRDARNFYGKYLPCATFSQGLEGRIRKSLLNRMPKGFVETQVTGGAVRRFVFAETAKDIAEPIVSISHCENAEDYSLSQWRQLISNHLRGISRVQ